MAKNILCPFHADTTPSMTIYGEWGHCWVCSAHVKASELGIPSNKHIRPEPTNVEERIKYIKSLPTKIIRGLQLPYDNSGYYLLWPHGNYYKRRNYEGKVRYIGPSGVKAPLYVCPGTASHLVIVEGELNAASLYQAVWGDFKVVSPGSASEFVRHIKAYLPYSKITIVADYDAAGVVHSLQLKDLLLKHKKDVKLILVNKDYSKILEESGEEGVREHFEREIR